MGFNSGLKWLKVNIMSALAHLLEQGIGFFWVLLQEIT